MRINTVIIQPILTEKATAQAQTKTYTFEVSRFANKHQVRKALELIYAVKVDDVRMTVRKGKTKKVGKKMAVKQMPNRKIATVHVKEGTIAIFPQV